MSIDSDLSIKELSSEHVGEEIATRNRKDINGLVIEHNKSDKDKEEQQITEATEQEQEQEEEREQEETNCLIDVLHLHMLQLMEEHISQNLALQTHISGAVLILARHRLQQGTLRQTVSTIHLPGSKSYRALCRIVAQSVPWGNTLKLFRFGVDTSRGFLEPITHIFGRLVPYSLRLAARKWERCVDQIVECVNVQRELQSVVESIERLKWSPHRRRTV